MDKIPAYIKNGKTVYFPALQDFATVYETIKEEREAERLKTILYYFDEFADSNEARMGLVELIEACGGEVPSDICTSCGSDEARYTSHYNNNAECS
jgi:hypothetical protein